MMLLLAALLCLTVLAQVTQGGVSDKCYSGLGLESGVIADDQISASDHTENPSLARLNREDGAWCFQLENIPFDVSQVALTIDLGTDSLVSGFQSQGPPRSKYPKDYSLHVGLEVQTSVNGRRWRQCCRNQTTFYANDKSNSSDVITNHYFGSLEPARFVRIVTSTLKWIGNEEKCFRFEILGCHVDPLDEDDTILEADLSFSYDALPAGFVATSWSLPAVKMEPKKDSVHLTPQHYVINVQYREAGSDIIEDFNTTEPSLIVPNPLWGVTYIFTIECEHRGLMIDCGSHKIIPRISASANQDCFTHGPECPLHDRVLFVAPTDFRAVSLANGSVEIHWQESFGGWRAPQMQLRLYEQTSQVVAESPEGVQSMLVSELSPNKGYELVLTPAGPDVPGKVKPFTASLGLIKDEESGKAHAFIAAVDMEAHIFWDGQVKVSWNEAKALAEVRDSEEVSQIVAEGYSMELRTANGKDLLQTAIVYSPEVSHKFGGITMGVTYQVVMYCSFPGAASLPCGTTTVASAHPMLVLEEDDSEEAIVFVEAPTPESWEVQENLCASSGGHLVSLESTSLEKSVAQATSLDTFWTGGNICRDSPAPPDSLWSDGTPTNYNHFMANSGLEAAQCCVRVDVIRPNSDQQDNEALWSGWDCDDILYAICEMNVEDYLDSPRDLKSASASPNSLNFTWSLSGEHWTPSNYGLQYCLVKSLSSAVLPTPSGASSGEECQELSLKDVLEASIQGLQPFSVYDVTLTAALEGFSKRTTATVEARTLPDREVDWVITPSGQLKVSWLKKIASFQEEDPVHLTLTNLASDSHATAVGTAQQVEVDSLQFGATYELVLHDEENDMSFGPIVFEAYPNCTHGSRKGFKCNYVSDGLFNHSESVQQCPSNALANNNLSEMDFKSSQHADKELFWVGNKYTVRDSTVSRDGRTEDELQPIIFEDDQCQAWSVSKSKYVSEDCASKLPIFCQTDLEISAPTPNETSLSIQSGPTHILLDWSKEERDSHNDKGWATNYTIQVIPLNDNGEQDSSNDRDADGLNRGRREPNSTQNTSPTSVTQLSVSHLPVNVTPLTPESEYTFVITTSLGPDWKTTMTLENLYTTANDSQLPEEIVGFNGSQKEVQAAQMSILAIVMVLILTAGVIFILSGTLPVYADNAMHFCFLLSFLLFLLSLLLAVADGPFRWSAKDPTLCTLSVAFLAFFSLSAFTFLLLESLCIASSLVKGIVCPLAEKIVLLVILGFAVPFVYTVITVPLLYEELMPTSLKTCWLNLTPAVSMTLIVPMALLFSVTVIFLLLAIFASSEDRLSSASYTLRKTTLRWTRYVMLAVTFLWGLGWSLGVTSAHFQREELSILFLVTLFLLAVVLLGLRCIMDKQVRGRLRRFGKTAEELGEVYVPSSRAASSVSGRHARRSSSAQTASATSRRSLISNQVAPLHLLQRKSITPVESEERLEEQPQNSSTTQEPIHTVTNNQRPQSCQRLVVPPLLRLGSAPSPKSSSLYGDSSAGRAAAQSVRRRVRRMRAECDWAHERNAIWQELERNSPRGSKNRQALRRFRRLCTEYYAPSLGLSTSNNIVSPVSSSAGTASAASSSIGPDDVVSPAKYVSPFGDTDADPVLPDNQGRLRSAGRFVAVLDQGDPYISLPNTPDTEDPYKKMKQASVTPQVITLDAAAGESHI